MPECELSIKFILSQPFGENTYIAYFKGRGDCVVVDPGLEPQKIVDFLDAQSLQPAAILCTHGHSDHIGGNAALKERWPDSPLMIGEGDAIKLTDPVQNLSAAFGVKLISPAADRTLVEGETVETAGFEFKVLETPGHCSGHIVYMFELEDKIRVFGGDVLFQGGIGRTDFPDGSFDQLENSIRTKLYTLPDDTVVLPGHGPPTTIGEEKATNPFVNTKE